MASLTSNEPKEFLVEKILKNYSNIFDKATSEQLSIIRRTKVIKPVMYIGMGSCGLIAGAEKTLKAVEKYLSDYHIDADIVRVGCLGLCSAEPLLDVQLPGKARLSFHHATENKVEDILNSVLHHTLTTDLVLGQFKSDLQEDWPNIPHLWQLPYFALQHRIILRHSGIISPYLIEDYIAHGGYKSLYKTVLNYTADKVCEIVDQSELRGRGGGGFPTGKKWLVTLGTGSDQKYLICNADESDPGAFMNRAIIEGVPHKVLEEIGRAHV